jgi:hypothetical protein
MICSITASLVCSCQRGDTALETHLQMCVCVCVCVWCVPWLVRIHILCSHACVHVCTNNVRTHAEHACMHTHVGPPGICHSREHLLLLMPWAHSWHMTHVHGLAFKHANIAGGPACWRVNDYFRKHGRKVRENQDKRTPKFAAPTLSLARCRCWSQESTCRRGALGGYPKEDIVQKKRVG